MNPGCQKVMNASVWMTAAVVCFVGVASLGVAQERAEARVAHHAFGDAEALPQRLLAGHRNIAAVRAGNGGQKIPIVVVVIAGVISLVAVIFLMVRHFEKKRTAALDVVAAEIGLAFSAAQDDELLARQQVFSLFNKGHSRKMRNVMKAEGESTTLAIFDYQYTTGSGKHQQCHSQTVVSVESDSLSLPRFTLWSEGLWAKLGAMMGAQDIDFDEHPEFSKSFVLKGDDVTAIRDFFDVEKLDFFAERKGAYVETAPHQFIYFRGKRRKPEQIRELMTEGYSAYAIFGGRSPSESSPDSYDV
ncbi:MAG: hypothetical protein GY903_03035 [Fuerstiella sp.]|nr:hypothetical protein [Fuerstiella sp.]MCP4853449.1 hypothetical protein [Fuerstiella sp.]